GDVHRPALPAAGPGGLAEEFRPQFAQRYTFGDLVVQTAVDGDDIVVGTQMSRDRDRGELLATRRVVHAADGAALHQRQILLVEELDPGRRAIERDLGIGVGDRRGRGHCLSWVSMVVDVDAPAAACSPARRPENTASASDRPET